jgi:hypothetical protein|tara:strand:+ start:1396 stop:1578 length:183 start_codon:yes stop_codon:yes gene_type:complete
MADLEINNQHDFFKDVRLDENGNVLTVVVAQNGAATEVKNAAEFYDRIALDENGKLKTFI